VYLVRFEGPELVEEVREALDRAEAPVIAEAADLWDHPLRARSKGAYTARVDAADPAAAVWTIREVLDDPRYAGFEAQLEI
jgi:hypothetical protein